MKIGKYKISVIQLLRALSQILFFIFLPALYISTFSGIKQVYLAVIHGSFSVTALLPQVIEAIAIIPATALLGRFFCGWMCAFGAMEDFISVISLRVFRRRFRINEKADKALKSLKYVLLAFLVVAVWTFGVNAFRASNPWDAFGMLLTAGKMPDLSYVASNLTPALIILVLIIAGSFFVERFFCRYLCPLGAVFAIASGLRVTSIRKPKTKCGNCRACTRSCPMGIALYREDAVRSGECINCFSCVSACPRKNVGLAVAENDVRPALAGAMAVAAMTGIYYAGSITLDAVGTGMTAASSYTQSAGNDAGGAVSPQPDTGSPDSSQAGGQTAPASKYKDGTYQGSGTGFRGATTTVSVTVKDGKITDVAIVSTGDTPRFISRAYPIVSQSIIGSQSVNVNAVSGATYSSLGIMQAVSDALSRAA